MYNSVATPRTVACQAPLSMGFPSPEYWSGLPFPPPGDLLDPGIELTFAALAGRLFTTEPPGKPHNGVLFINEKNYQDTERYRKLKRILRSEKN